MFDRNCCVIKEFEVIIVVVYFKIYKNICEGFKLEILINFYLEGREYFFGIYSLVRKYYYTVRG